MICKVKSSGGHSYSYRYLTVTEHISLEEISSDSADEILNEQKKSKKTTKAATTSAQPTNTSANANNGTGKKT